MNEHDYAMRDAHMAYAVDAYFKARPQLMRTIHEERIYEAGFKAAWDCMQSALSEATARAERAEAELKKARERTNPISDEYLIEQFSAAVMLSTKEDGSVDNKKAFRGFANRILMEYGDRQGMYLAFRDAVSPIPAPAAQVQQEWRDAAGYMLEMIDKAGIHNLANGVQLGAISWAVKMTDACDTARALLQEVKS